MPYNPYAPYPSGPYGAPSYGYGTPTPAAPSNNTYAFVNGIEGAKSYVMQPNQMVMLMDSDNPVVYMKQSNAMGQSTIKCFKLVETTEAELTKKSAPIGDFVTKADFDELVKRVDGLMGKKE